MLKLVPILAALLIAGTAPAQAQGKAKLDRLIERAIDAGRVVVEESAADPKERPRDRRDLQGQFALLLIRAGKCAEAEKFVAGHPEVKAMTISRVISASLPKDQSCAQLLAPHMLARWDDPDYEPMGRVGARFRAAAYLDQAGDPGAWDILRAADADMQRLPEARGRWSIRFDGLDAYPAAAPKRQRYLEFLAERMKAEKPSASESSYRGILAVFAYQDRCDLVALATQPGPHSCDEAQRLADSIYRTPPSPGMEKLAADIRAARPAPDEASLREAIAVPDRWMRLTRLLFLVESCKRALAAR